MLIYLTKAYQTLIFFGNLLKSPLLLICRLYWGALFIFQGWEKLGDITKFTHLLEQYQFSFPTFQAYLAGTTEVLGGICLALGLASRLVTLPLIFLLLTAYSSVHVESLHALFHQPHLFVAEPPFNFLLISFLVLAFGPGRFSLDYMLEKWLFSGAKAFSKHQHL